MLRSLSIALILACVCCSAAARAQTEPSPAPTAMPESSIPTDDQWHYAVIPYIWLPTINATANLQTPGLITSSPVIVNVAITPSQYVSKLNFAILAAFEARRKGTTFLADYINMNASASAGAITTIRTPNGRIEIPLTSSVNSHVFTGISTLAVGFTALAGHGSNLDVIGGIRTVSSRVVADYSLTGPVTEVPHTGSLSRSIFLMDPIIGIKGRVGLATRWYVPYEADVGAGSDNTTWQYFAGISYAGRTNDIIAGYRALGYNETGDQLLQHLRLSGPFIGLRIHW